MNIDWQKEMRENTAKVAKPKEYTETEMAVMGAKLGEILGMERDTAYPDRWLTSWGNKTDLGLFRTLRRIGEDIEKGIFTPENL